MDKTITQFNGFNNNLLSKETDFVKIPVQAFDLLYQCQGEAETKTLLAILQKLRQFGKAWDWINNENLLTQTGLSRNSITKAILSLTKKNIILIRKVSGRRIIFLNTKLAEKICQMIDDNLIKFTDLIKDKVKGFAKLFNKLREYFKINQTKKSQKNFESRSQSLTENNQTLTTNAQSLGTHIIYTYNKNNIQSNNNNNTIDYTENIPDTNKETLPEPEQEPGKNNLIISGGGSAVSFKKIDNNKNNLQEQIIEIKKLSQELNIILPDFEIKYLLKSYPLEAIKQQLNYLPYRTYKNPVAMLKAALSKGYDKPVKLQSEDNKQSENNFKLDYMNFVNILGFNANINAQENDILKYILENISLTNENSFYCEPDFIQKTHAIFTRLSEKTIYDILYGFVHVGAINPFFRHIDFKELIKTSGKEKTTEIIFNILKGCK